MSEHRHNKWTFSYCNTTTVRHIEPAGNHASPSEIEIESEFRSAKRTKQAADGSKLNGSSPPTVDGRRRRPTRPKSGPRLIAHQWTPVSQCPQVPSQAHPLTNNPPADDIQAERRKRSAWARRTQRDHKHGGQKLGEAGLMMIQCK